MDRPRDQFRLGLINDRQVFVRRPALVHHLRRQLLSRPIRSPARLTAANAAAAAAAAAAGCDCARNAD